MHKRAKENGWQAEIINGVPSFCAVAAKLGISLGEKKEEIHIIPAAYEVEDTFSYSGTCVYMKSGKRLAELLDALRSRQDKTGKIYEVWGVSNCGKSKRVSDNSHCKTKEIKMRQTGFRNSICIYPI